MRTGMVSVVQVGTTFIWHSCVVYWVGAPLPGKWAELGQRGVLCGTEVEDRRA